MSGVQEALWPNGDDSQERTTPVIRSDGSVLYDGYVGGRVGVPQSSPGYVFIAESGDTTHYDENCQWVRQADQARLEKLDDPSGRLWAEILQFAPIPDKETRATRARAIGLQNGNGGPIIWVCQSCVVRVKPRRSR
jgi:hypothetical protein